jgi:hypothetical protein
VSPDELRAYVVESRARQGLPPTVTDPATLERVAAVFRLMAPTIRRRQSRANTAIGRRSAAATSNPPHNHQPKQGAGVETAERRNSDDR